ncbi:MAG: RAD55 family ATPase [Thermoplasmata archaeon]
MMTVDPIEIQRVAEEFSLDKDYTWVTDAKIKGKSGIVHKFDLVVSSKQDENVKIAVLNGVSDDLVNDIMKFNATANDCGIQLKALVVDKELGEAENNLARIYNIVTINKKEKKKRKNDIFGVKELDDAIGGAMQRGNIYLIAGKTGVGKTTSCTQFLVQGAKYGEKGAIILTDTRGTEYISNARTFTFGFEEYYREGKIEVIELSDRIRELKEDVMESLKNRTRYISRLTGEIKKLVSESNISRLAIDPITPMLVPNDDFINQFMMSLAIPDTYLLITSPTMNSDVSMYGIEEYFVSGVLKLEMEDLTTGLRKATIVKMRGGEFNPQPFYFRITSKGIVPATESNEVKRDSIFKRVVV